MFEYLLDSLPSYIIPSKFLRLLRMYQASQLASRLPLLYNGKDPWIFKGVAFTLIHLGTEALRDIKYHVVFVKGLIITTPSNQILLDCINIAQQERKQISGQFHLWDIAIYLAIYITKPFVCGFASGLYSNTCAQGCV